MLRLILLTTLVLSSSVHADEFADVRASLAMRPLNHTVLKLAMAKALTFNFSDSQGSGEDFDNVRWALAPALREYFTTFSIETEEQLETLEMALRLAGQLKLADLETIHLIVNFHNQKAPLVSRVFGTAWAQKYAAVKHTSLNTIRILVSYNDRAARKYADANWDERQGKSCTPELRVITKE